jgi:WG containing repeat
MLRWDLKLFLLLIAVSVTTNSGSVAQAGVPAAEISAVDEVPKPVNRNGRWGYANGTGQFVIKPKYFAAEPFSEGLALVVTRKPWQPLGSVYGEFRLAQITYIDRSGHEIHAPLSVRRARSFADGRAVVVPDYVLRAEGGCAKGGYLDTKGDWAIKPQFDGLSDFSEGLAAVNLGANCAMEGKWGYVGKEGQTVIPFKFLWAGAFLNLPQEKCSSQPAILAPAVALSSARLFPRCNGAPSKQQVRFAMLRASSRLHGSLSRSVSLGIAVWVEWVGVGAAAMKATNLAGGKG